MMLTAFSFRLFFCSALTLRLHGLFLPSSQDLYQWNKRWFGHWMMWNALIQLVQSSMQWYSLLVTVCWILLFGFWLMAVTLGRSSSGWHDQPTVPCFGLRQTVLFKWEIFSIYLAHILMFEIWFLQASINHVNVLSICFNGFNHRMINYLIIYCRVCSNAPWFVQIVQNSFS